jgi:hypothetical protein
MPTNILHEATCPPRLGNRAKSIPGPNPNGQTPAIFGSTSILDTETVNRRLTNRKPREGIALASWQRSTIYGKEWQD